MPRDATATREEIMVAGTRLFARRGLHAVTVRELHEAAGQRNASALQYHFGSREGLLLAIVERYQNPIDEARAEWLARADDLGGYVEALVEPPAALLSTPAGRHYLQIINQVVGDLGLRDSLLTEPPNAVRALAAMAAEMDDVPTDERNARVANVVVFVTAALAHRARLVEARRAVLDHDAWVADLVTSVIGALTARSDRPARTVGSPRPRAGARPRS
ncbi:MAG: TetR family transcriptional regulator [Actinomycetota bacterium]|nr:TetR family transcriptional regulator [Actinomycetota bacterium]